MDKQVKLKLDQNFSNLAFEDLGDFHKKAVLLTCVLIQKSTSPNDDKAVMFFLTMITNVKNAHGYFKGFMDMIDKYENYYEDVKSIYEFDIEKFGLKKGETVEDMLLTSYFIKKFEPLVAKIRDIFDWYEDNKKALDEFSPENGLI